MNAGREMVDRAYAEEYEAIQGIMERVGIVTTENQASPARLLATEYQLSVAPEALQAEVASAIGTDTDALRNAIGQSLFAISMQHSRQMILAGQAITGLYPTAPSLGPLRRVAEQLLALAETRCRLLAHLRTNEYGLMDNIVIYDPSDPD